MVQQKKHVLHIGSLSADLTVDKLRPCPDEYQLVHFLMTIKNHLVAININSLSTDGISEKMLLNSAAASSFPLGATHRFVHLTSPDATDPARDAA